MINMVEGIVNKLKLLRWIGEIRVTKTSPPVGVLSDDQFYSIDFSIIGETSSSIDSSITISNNDIIYNYVFRYPPVIEYSGDEIKRMIKEVVENNDTIVPVSIVAWHRTDYKIIPHVMSVSETKRVYERYTKREVINLLTTIYNELEHIWL